MKFTKIAFAMMAMVGVAGADKHTEKKADKVPEAKVDPKAAKPEAAKPPAEIDMLAKSFAGTWKCKGDSFEPGGAKSPITATNKAKLDMDKFWVNDSIEVKGATMTFKMNAFTTYDSAAKKWRRVAITNGGGYMVGTSDGLKDGKMDWTLDTVGPMGTGQFREHIDTSDAKAGAKFWGEMSNDKGKTWVKVYEMACKK